ncbi:hypothetical protein JOL62DRAFT_642814, partial [Phyllosticta paracitricarpa]
QPYCSTTSLLLLYALPSWRRLRDPRPPNPRPRNPHPRHLRLRNLRLRNPRLRNPRPRPHCHHGTLSTRPISACSLLKS